MKYTYHDKHGKEILEGMTIRHDDGEMQKVYATEDQYGNEGLGILATNPAYLERHPDHEPEYYPLSNFDLSEWEIAE